MKSYFTIFFLLLVIFLENTICQKKDVFKVLYYPNGKVSSEGYLRDGKPNGYWISYYPDGIKKSEGKRESFLLDSTWVFFDEVGDTDQIVNYFLGKKNGVYLTFCSKVEIGLKRKYLCKKEIFLNDKREGISYIYYENGQVLKLKKYVSGKENGLSFEYDKNGLAIVVEEYVKGILIDRQIINRYDKVLRKQGKWMDFYDDGKIKRECFYKEGNLEGLLKEYADNGSLTINLLYHDGKLVENTVSDSALVDKKEEFYSDGTAKFSGTFKKGLPIGIHRWYNAKGIVDSSILFNEFGKKISCGIINNEGEKNGKWLNYFDLGKIKSIGFYKKNLPEGKWIYYNSKGYVEQIGFFLSGKENGKWIWFYENGKTFREEEFSNGLEDGEYVEFDVNGDTLQKGHYIEGEKTGYWYEKSGDDIEEGNYSADLRDGLWKGFYDNKQIMYIGKYIQGNPNERFKIFYDTGKLLEEREYSMGKRNGTWKEYDKNGTIIFSITYKNDEEVRINGQKVTYNKVK
jgi:uncharacterized protein